MRNKILSIVLVSSLALIGLIFIQGSWLRKAIRLNEQELERTTKRILTEVFHDQEISLLPSFTEHHSFALTQPVKDSILKITRQQIDSVFSSQGINDPYEFAIMGCCEKPVIVSTNENLNSKLQKTNIVSGIKGQNSAEHVYHLGLLFTSKRNFLLRHLGLELGLGLFLLLVFLGAFSYTLISFNKYKKLSALKDDFINNMTHEFKTPIGSIRLAARMLQKESPLNEKQTSYVNLIDNESHRLETQADKVLQVAMIDSGNFQLEKTPSNVHQLIEKIASNFKVVVTKLNGQISLSLYAENPVINLDPVHFNNVLYNLLDNAIKYNAREPEITIGTKNNDSGIIIAVADNGIGIRPESRDRIFEKFFRERNDFSSNKKGFGLGLGYVRHIINAHKGTINVESLEGTGSTFTLFFPYE